MNNSITLVLLIGILLYISNAIATIRSVPGSYPSINTALTSAEPNDTILIAQGTYRERVMPAIDVTIASAWMLTRDTNDIHQTIWIPDTGKVIFSNQHNIVLNGIHFNGGSVPMVNRGVIHAIGGSIIINDCRVLGTFDTTRYAGTNVIYANGSHVTISNTVFDGPDTGSCGAIDVVYGSLTLRKVSFLGRPYGIDVAYAHVYGTLIADSCEIRNDGAGLDVFGNATITNCRFTQCGTLFLVVGGGNTLISNCLFENIPLPNWYTIIWTGNSNDTTIFTNCKFRNIIGDANLNTALFHGDGRLEVKSCGFSSISNLRRLFRSQKLFVDSCSFDSVAPPIYAGRNPNPTASINNCDFPANQRFFSGDQWFPDTMFAQNCYWGDATGPMHILTPNGQGTLLPNWVFPLPFRTTPVFPENGVSDPRTVSYSLPHSIALLPPYPNPFNASVTIRFRLPHPGEASIAVYDVTGREVATLQRGYFANVEQSIQWQPQTVSSGTYFVRLQNGSKTSAEPIQYLK